MLGEVIGGYRLEDKLGEGGMGVVFRATQTVLGRAVAIKLMRARLCSDEESVQRFFNEAVLTASIRHPGIVEIFDYGVHTNGSAYIAMALLDGESLEGRLARQPSLGLVESLRIAQQIASALSAAHERGVVHRDLKPDNVFLTPDPDLTGGERIRLLDFGIAKLLGDDHQSSSLTRTGTMIGTPLYMSPEQCRGRSDIDGRSDLYSLGCMLYQMLAGRPPFSAASPIEVAAAHMRDPAPPIAERRPGVPDAVADLVSALLAKRAEDRPLSADAVKRLLGETLAVLESGAPSDRPPALIIEPADSKSLELAPTLGENPPRSRRWLVIAAAGAIAAAAIGVLGWRLAATSEPAALAAAAAPIDCGALPALVCVAHADVLARGDGVRPDRRRASWLALDACRGGSERACWAFLDLVRTQRTVFEGSPSIGLDGAALPVVVVTNLAGDGLERLYRELHQLERAYIGRVAIHLVARPTESLREERAALAACVAHRLGVVRLFAGLRGSDSRRRPDWDDADIGLLARGAGVDFSEVRSWLGECAERVARQQRDYRWLEIGELSAFVGGARLAGPFSIEALAALVDSRREILGDRERSVLAQRRAVPSTVRLPAPRLPAAPAPVTLVEYCDPAVRLCKGRQQMLHALARVYPDRVRLVFKPFVVADGAPAVAAAACAAARQRLSIPFGDLLFARATGAEPVTAAELRDLGAASGADLARWDRDLAGPCPADLAANAVDLERLTGTLEPLTLVNGRPAPRGAESATAALVFEELDLARLLGYATRIPAADYHDHLITSPDLGAAPPRFSRPPVEPTPDMR
jgi:hypothetical protein